MAVPLRMTVLPDRVDAAAGDSPAIAVTARNTSDIVEHYVVEVLGLPAGVTARTEPDITKLRPGETGNATVHLTVAADPPAAAGQYTLGVMVRSRYRTEVSHCEELTLVVAPAERITIRIEPEVATGGRFASYSVAIANDGNTPAALRLAATDPERHVTATFQPPVLDLAPGTAGRVTLAVSAPIPWSKEKQRTLRIEATGHDVRVEAPASFVQRPRFAAKVVRVAGVLGAAVALAAGIVVAVVVSNQSNQTNQSQGQGEANVQPTPAATPAPASGDPSASVSPDTSTPSAVDTTTPGPVPLPEPVTVNLTEPDGGFPGGMLASGAFPGLTLEGVPAEGGECADANAVVVRGDAIDGYFLTAARAADPATCNELAVRISFASYPRTIEVIPGGVGLPQVSAWFRDGTEQKNTPADVEPLAVHGKNHGGIVRIEVGPAVPAPGAPVDRVGVQTLRYWPPATAGP